MAIRQTLFRDQVLSDRERKNLAILDVIRKSGPVTRTEISKVTKLNIVTVSNYVNSYVEKNLVIEKGLKTGLTAEDIKAYCAGKLAMHKVPKYIEFTENLHISSTGKKVKVFSN